MILFSSFADELEKIASLGGASTPKTIEHAAIPYKTRKEQYAKYLKEKSKEDPTSKGKAALIGGAIGLIGGPAIPITVPAGAIIGAAMAAADKGEIEKSKRILREGNIDHAMANRISRQIERREDSREWREDMRHREMMRELRRNRRY